VGLAADLAFETDADGRFVFIMPEQALGWPIGMLLGQPSEVLLGDDGATSAFNPFRPTAEVRRRRAWLRRYDGSLATMALSVAPLHDAAGGILGARGIGIDLTDDDAQSSQIASRLRRGEVLDHILSRVGQEATAEQMMDAALWAMIHTLGAAGAAVVAPGAEGMPTRILHQRGPGASAILATADRLLATQDGAAAEAAGPDGRPVLAVRCHTRFGTNAGLVIWRAATVRPWDRDDAMIAGSAAGIVRMILEYEAVQEEMAHQARTDPLTGLLNRRAFLEEMQRQTARLDREAAPGTMMYIDLDGFKAVNDSLGHAVGDAMLIRLSDMLRRLVRPSDLVARLGGDEFAVWLSGVDQMTAAERADNLCKTAPVELGAVAPEAFASLGLSIGVAMRKPGSQESVEALVRRADMAMYGVKRAGRNHWRVATEGDA
jgi:diguanylate cyclase (GGDEF)-like protein